MNRLKIIILFSFLICLEAKAQFDLNGSAISINDTCFQLTSDVNWQVGSIWNEEKVNLNSSFEVEVDLFFGTKDEDGADGLVFGLQPLSTSIGVAGGDLGIGGVTPSLGIEFDVFQNIDFEDPLHDHIAIVQDGVLRHNAPQGALAGPVAAISDESNIEDGEHHRVRISWDAENQELLVFFDCDLRLTYEGDIVDEIFNGNPEVFWGFTSATGGLSNIHEVCFSRISFLDELEDQSVCRGTSVQLEASGGVSYRWSPVEGLSDPNIANPTASPETTTRYIVEIIDDCGLVFRDDVLIEIQNDETNLFLIPNIFSPNGDGNNDLFGIFPAEDEELRFENYSFRIFNRWGQTIFESTNPSVFWNGIFENNPATTDVYIYTIEFDLNNCTFNKTGDVSLIR